MKKLLAQRIRPDKLRKTAYITFQVLVMASFATTAFAAEGNDIWSRASFIMKDVYGKIVMVSTIVAVVASACALILMNFSKSSRTVDEARTWLKRIVISWALLNSLGLILAYVVPLFQGGNNVDSYLNSQP